jgi:glycosyltransferase involved in cell wall biosynthesis
MNKYKLSICIPTFNRAKHLVNCLQSIISIRSRSNATFQVCVADNCSTDETEAVVYRAQESIDIKYHRNNTNLGIPKNFLNVVNMADGEFVWLIGDDDLLLPSAVDEFCKLSDENPDVDYFYINSFHLTTEYVLSFPQPFNTTNLPKDMKPFSSYTHTMKMMFMDLINPKVSFDFLGGMFLSVFRRDKWNQNINALDEAALSDMRIFSHFDNTFPHVKIFSKAFADSKAYFSAVPLSVCLTGAREWAPMQPLVMSVRLVEALDEYRKNGLPYFKFLYCKNFALNNFIPDLGSMIVYKNTGLSYVNPFKLIISNCLYPNFYFSFVRFIFRKLKILFTKLTKRGINENSTT